MPVHARVGYLTALVFIACSTSNGSSGAPPPPAIDAGEADAGAPVDSTAIAAALVPSPAGSLYATEPSIAVSASGVVAVASLDRATRAVGPGFILPAVVFSPDRGKTWSTPERIALPDGRFGGNEIVQAGRDGTFFLVTLGVMTDASSSAVYVAKAAPGASTFGPAMEISDPAAKVMRDATAMVVASDQSLNVVWTEYDARGSSGIVAARSTDAGATWTRTPLTSPDAFAWPNVCASADGAGLVVVYEDPTSRKTHLRWSEDDGATWAESNHNALAWPASLQIGEFPSCVTAGSDVWVLEGMTDTAPTTERAPPLVDVRLTHAGGRGRSLSSPVSVVDPAGGARAMRAMASVAPDRSISIVYYAGAKDDDPAAAVRRVRSTDGGKTFGPSEVVFSPMELVTARRGTKVLGDLLGVASDSHNTFASFVDNQGVSRVRLSRLAP